MKKPTLLFLTDLNYIAAGRAYYTEDIMLTGELKDTFDIILADPRSSEPFESHVDAIVIRNSGPITHYLEAFGQFKERVIQQGLKTFNSMDGKADMRGKYYLPKLCQAGYQVTPSIADPKAIDQLPEATEYVVKPMLGADSIGLKFVERAAIETLPSNEYVIQPRLDIQEEHSLFFLNNQFCYALKTVGERWELESFTPNDGELRLADTFIDWNQMKTGIQRVDFAKTHEGLFLVELEDINPFLSLELLHPPLRQNFMDQMKQALLELIQ